MHLNSMLYGISVGLLLTASAAFAQDRMTAAQCQGSVDAILSLSVLDPESIPSPPQVDEEGWCQLENVILEQSAYNQINAGLIRWRATGIARLIDQGLPPARSTLKCAM